MGLKKSFITGSSIVLLLLSFLVASSVSAESGETYFSPEDSGSVAFEDFSFDITNEKERASLTINGTNLTEVLQYEQAYIETVAVKKADDTFYLSVVTRYSGTANAFVTDTYTLGDDVKKIHTTDEWIDANLHFTENGFEVTSVIQESPEDAPRTFKTAYLYKGDEVVTDENFSSFARSSQQESFSTQSTTKVNIVGTNPSPAALNKLLTEEAVKRNIPPEIVKAIAFQEAGWAHYWNEASVPVAHYQQNCTPAIAAANPNKLAWDGTNLKLGYDCIGIGLMQVSDWRFIQNKTERDRYVARLKSDLQFNISEGLAILESKWRFQYQNFSDRNPHIPKLNDQDRRIIDNWYFATMAYNGVLKRNDPNETGIAAYQERIYHHINQAGLIKLSPFPKEQLVTSAPSNVSFMRFNKYQFNTTNPITMTKAQLKPGDHAYTTESVNFRSLSNVNSVSGTISANTKVKILPNALEYPNQSNYNHYHFVPVETEDGRTGYVASSYISKISVSLAGQTRYDTAISISKEGWDNVQTDSVVIGRGDVPIDSLTGSVLAANLEAPLLLNTSVNLEANVLSELERLNPEKVYLLGGTSALSLEIERRLITLGYQTFRVSGASRYGTAAAIADQYSGNSVPEIFLTTGNEKSPDALSIASYAGHKDMPILITTSGSLRDEVKEFIQRKNVKKVTIIGGTLAVSEKVAGELRNLGVTVDRVSGTSRYDTSAAIVKKYYPQAVNSNRVFVARGDVIVDALSGSALAGKYGAPLVLTESSAAPEVITSWLNGYNKRDTKPTLYFLGSTTVIQPKAREALERAALR